MRVAGQVEAHMATPGEKVFVVLDHDGREEAFEVTRKVDNWMALVGLLSPDLPPSLTSSMREAAIRKAAEQLVRKQARRGNRSTFTGIWYTSRVPPLTEAASPSVGFPATEESP